MSITFLISSNDYEYSFKHPMTTEKFNVADLYSIFETLGIVKDNLSFSCNDKRKKYKLIDNSRINISTNDKTIEKKIVDIFIEKSSNDDKMKIYKFLKNKHTENIEELFKEIDTLNTKIKSLESDINYKSIYELACVIKNTYQQNILDRLTTNNDYSKIYLSDYKSIDDDKMHGSVIVLGTFNHKKNCREAYKVNIYKTGLTFYCNCPDHKFNSASKNSVCKHICFLVCKILKVLNPYFFETKTLKEEHLIALLAKLSSDNIWKDNELIKIPKTITLNTFKTFTKTVDDCCPICFNDITDDDKELLNNCPTCCNYVHTECIEIWLERQQNCVFCLSDVWKHYKTVKNGAEITLA